MTSIPKLLRLTLPILAVGLGATALTLMLPSRSDSTVHAAESVPAGTRLSGARVAGAGLVEPASELIEIAAPVAGIVREVHVVAGQSVEAGAPLLRLDDRTARAAVAEREAALISARAALAEARLQQRQAERERERLAAIQSRGLVTAEDLDRRRYAVETAQAQVQTQQARVAEADAALQAARTALDLTVVRAPIAGTVLQVSARPGQFAGTGAGAEPLLRFGQTAPLHVRIDIDEADIARVDPAGMGEIVARGAFGQRAPIRRVRVEPLVIPKRSLTNQPAERVDTRVLQVIYALPAERAADFVVGQQVDAYLPAIGS